MNPCQCGIPARYEHECVRSDVPIPQTLLAKKRRSGRTTRQPSQWPNFFKNWIVGDSVLVSWTALISMQQHAKKLDQKIVWQQQPQTSMDGMSSARVWRVE